MGPGIAIALFLWLMSALCFALGFNQAVHGSPDGVKLNWSIMARAVGLIFLGICWTSLGFALIS